MSISARHFAASDWGGVHDAAAAKVGQPWDKPVSAVEASLSTADRAFAYMSNAPTPGGTPQAAGSQNRGSGKTFGTATPVSGK
jgi:hypothetical protein